MVSTRTPVLDENFAVMVKTVECFSDLIEGVGAYGVTPYKIAKIKKCGQASDHVTRKADILP